MEWAAPHHPHAGWILTAPADVPFLPLDLTVRLCGLMHVPEPDVLMVRHGRRREHALAVWSVKLAAICGVRCWRRACAGSMPSPAPRRWPNWPGRAAARRS